jgi:hypothetical protein
MIVPMPMVMACCGTFWPPPKKRALSRRVRGVSVLMRVRDASDEDADAEQLQINAAGGADLFFVAFAHGRDVFRRAVRHMDVFCRQVQMPEQMLVHEAVVGLRVRRRNANVFIEVERGDFAPVQFQLHQFAIEQQRRATGGQAQHGVRFFPDQPGNHAGRNQRGGFRIRLDDNFHGKRSGSPFAKYHAVCRGNSIPGRRLFHLGQQSLRFQWEPFSEKIHNQGVENFKIFCPA